MTVQNGIFERNYHSDLSNTTQSSQSHLFLSLHHPARQNEGLMRKLFIPSAGALYLNRPSKRRHVFKQAVEKFERHALPGYKYVIDHLYDKYRRNLTISTIAQTGYTLHGFLIFLRETGISDFETISRKDIANYIDHEQERGLAINSVSSHLQTVYAFLYYLVDNEVVSPDLIDKKIRVKLPEVLPRAIPTEDLKEILAVVTSVRDRALILILLHTGMRIGELLQLKITDIILPERKILLFIGEKNLHGRVVYYNHVAGEALKKWLAARDKNSDYLFYGYRWRKLSYAAARKILKKIIQKAGLEQNGYSLHSLRHTFATNMINAGLRLEVLQKLLGHLSIEMTLRYAKIADGTKEEAYFKAMAVIEKGENHEYDRVNPELQAVFEEEELFRTDS